MRACQGCRKRKIKCDSATTNIWPCAACTRLKLVCVPPSTTDQDFESTVFEQQPVSAEQQQSAPSNRTNNITNIITTAAPQLGDSSSLLPHAPGFQPSPTHTNSLETAHRYTPPTKPYPSQPPPPRPPPRDSPHDVEQPVYLSNSLELCDPLQTSFHSTDTRQPTLSYLPIPPASFPVAAAQPAQHVEQQPSEQTIGNPLSDAFGELKIDETGIGMLLASHAIYPVFTPIPLCFRPFICLL